MNSKEADFLARNEALRLSVRCYEGHHIRHETIIAAARDFHAFLTDSEAKAEDK